MFAVDLSRVPATAQDDLCTMAIMGAAAALETPEGRAAIEKGRQEYLRHLEEKAARLKEKEESE